FEPIVLTKSWHCGRFCRPWSRLRRAWGAHMTGKARKRRTRKLTKPYEPAPHERAALEAYLARENQAPLEAEPMNNEPLEREPIDRMRARLEALRDVAPALNGRASLARVRPCRTGAASFMVARARGRARWRA